MYLYILLMCIRLNTDNNVYDNVYVFKFYFIIYTYKTVIGLCFILVILGNSL